MQKVADLTLSDYFGSEYTFEVYRRGSGFDDVAGVYAFVKRGTNQHGPWRKILYIGRTISFKQRLNYNHEKWSDAVRMKYTHICVHRVLPTTKREMLFIEPELARIEKNLIAKYNPPLNYKVG